MVIGDLPTKHTKYTKPLPTGEAAPAERLEVTQESPPVRKASPFVRRPLPRPPVRFAAAGFACLAAVYVVKWQTRENVCLRCGTK